MINPELKNKLVPWQEQGRWYAIFLESDGTDITFTEGDYGSQGNIVEDDNVFAFEEGFHVLDVKFDVNNDTGTEKWWQHRTRFYANGVSGVELPAADNFDYLTMYVFGYYD